MYVRFIGGPLDGGDVDLDDIGIPEFVGILEYGKHIYRLDVIDGVPLLVYQGQAE